MVGVRAGEVAYGSGVEVECPVVIVVSKVLEEVVVFYLLAFSRSEVDVVSVVVTACKLEEDGLFGSLAGGYSVWLPVAVRLGSGECRRSHWCFGGDCPFFVGVSP